MVRFLVFQGFQIVRVRGSHHILARDIIRTSVPVHGAQILKIGTLRGILREIDCSPSEFSRLWNSQT